MKSKCDAFLVLAALVSSGGAVADGCDTYPYSTGMTYEETGSGPKIISTQETAIEIDDVAEVLDAQQEAEMEAKARIASFLTEDIQKDENRLDNAVANINIAGDSKAVTKDTVKKKLKQMSNSTKALLRGVVRLGDCVTKGRSVRVSVGIKPETILAAEKAAGAISDSVQRKGAPGSASGTRASSDPASTGTTGGTSRPLTGVDSSSNTKGLERF